MTTPLSNKPKITQQDIAAGTVKRYFTRNVSSGVVTEIDKKQYDIFIRNPLYQMLTIDWIISGYANDTLSKTGKIIYGTKHKNATAVAFYERQLPGLSRVLRNPLEYFFGVMNKPVVVSSAAVTQNIYTVTAPSGSTAEEEPLPILVAFPEALTFIVTQSASVPAPQLVYLTELDARSIEGLTYQSTPYSWVSASLSGTSTPATMSVHITSSLVATGSYTANITVSSSITEISTSRIVPINVSVVKFDYETIFMDFYKLHTPVNLDVYGPYTYNGGSARWSARDFNLINIAANTNGVARLRHHIPMDRTRIQWYMFKYGAPATNVAGLALAVPTGSAETDYIRVFHISSNNSMGVVFVSASGATTTLTSSLSNAAPLNLSTGTNFLVDIVNNQLTLYSGSVQILTTQIPSSITSYLTDTSRTIGFYSSTTNQAGGVAFGQLQVTRSELQPYTSSVPIWNNTVMHLDAANTSSYIGSLQWQDLTGFFNSGSGNGVVYDTDASGSFVFGGGTDTFTLSNEYSIKPELPITFATWVKPTSLSTAQGLFRNDIGLGTNYYGVWINIGVNGDIGVNYGNGGLAAGSSRRTGTTPTGVVQSGSWNNVVCVIRGATDMSVYVNGVSQSISYSGTGGAIAYTTNAGSLGFTGTNGNFYFTGSMGMATVFASGLTQDEVTAYYNRTKTRFGY